MLTVDAASSTSTKLVFDLSVANTGDWTVADADTITLDNIELILDGDSISVASVFTTASDVAVSSTAAPAVEVGVVVDQWVAGVVTDLDDASPTSGELDDQIDVGDDRETLVGGASDDLTFDVNTQGSGATLVNAEVTISGDFTGVASVVAANNGSATYDINSTNTEATYTYTTSTDTTVAEVTANASVVTFTVATGDDAVSLDARSYTIDLDVNYTDVEATAGEITLLDGADAGNWSLNGSTDSLDYFPFGPNTQPIWHATSSFDEDVMYDIEYLTTSGTMKTIANVGTIYANAVTKLGVEIADAIIADSGEASGKTKVTLSVNAPSGDVVYFHAFKDLNDADRLGL